MKKVLLSLLMIFICLKSFSIIYYQPYPITAVVGVNGTNERIECSVYDSLLHSWQYYHSPYFLDTIIFTSSNASIIGFRTWTPSPQNDNDSIFGFITYDQVLHQFMPVILYHYDSYNWYNGGYVGVSHGEVSVFTQSKIPDYYGTLYDYEAYEAYIYNINVHAWQGGLMADAYSRWDETSSESLGDGGLVYTYYNDDFRGNGPISGCNFFDPVAGSFRGTYNGAAYWDAYGDQDLYSATDYFWRTVSYSAFDPSLHGWNYFSVPQSNDGNIRNGIFYVYDGNANNQYFGIYDDSLHHWLVDTILNSYVPYNSVKIKDKVIAYPQGSWVHCQVFSPTSRKWVKDSTQTNGINNLSIVEGTVHWTDNNGVNYIRGYKDALGWGNFITPLQLNFHITDFYSATGEPLIFVRDYSIGTDSTWYDFGNGVVTQSGKQHSLWQLVKTKKHCTSAPINYTVCIKANTSTGLHSQCRTVLEPCSADVLATSICNGVCNGSAIAFKMTGAKPISYLWSNGSTASQTNSLCAGDYSVTITNHAGCAVHKNFKITEMKLGITTMDNYCSGGCKGSASVDVNNGTPPYSYLWSNGETTDLIKNLCTGIYTVTVTDAHQCSKVMSDSIKELNVFTVIDRRTRPFFCDEGGDIFYQFKGGVPPYSAVSDHGLNINIDFNSGNYPDGVLTLDYGDFSYYNPLQVGIYTTTVSDASGCTFVLIDTIPAPPPITSFHLTSPINPTCHGICNGYFNFTVTGGTPPYYLADTANINIGCAGLHHIIIVDGFECPSTIIDTMTLVDPPSTNFHISTINYPPTCNSCPNGAIKVIFSGGTPPYTIHYWYPERGILAGDSLYHLRKGVYEIDVHDAMSCPTYIYDTLKVVTPRLEQSEADASISIAPNPAKNQFTIYDDANSIKNLEVFNAIGESILTRKIIAAAETLVNCENFSPGIYFVKCKTENGNVIKKLVVE